MNIYDYIGAMIFSHQIALATGARLASCFLKSAARFAFVYLGLLVESNGWKYLESLLVTSKIPKDMVELLANHVFNVV